MKGWTSNFFNIFGKSKEEEVSLSQTSSDYDLKRLKKEFSEALENCSLDDLAGWGVKVLKIFSYITIRRIDGFFGVLKATSCFVFKEGTDAAKSIFEGRFLDHLSERAQAGIEETKNTHQDLVKFKENIVDSLKKDPKGASSKFFLGFLGFWAGSGGPKGDGGVPDLDFAFGIGAHRSIFFHSIISGIVIEALFLSALELVKVIHGKLPEDHDSTWDDLLYNSNEATHALLKGVSTGIAYHLGIDATIDGAGTYKDLPFSIPLIGHQSISGANALAELIDSFRKRVSNPLDWFCDSIDTDLKGDKVATDATVEKIQERLEYFSSTDKKIKVRIHNLRGNYKGELKNSTTPHGQGVFQMIDRHEKGNLYGMYMEGNFIDGVFQDQAIIIDPDGGTYVGQVQFEKRHGLGTQQYPKGNKYIGEWLNGKRHGNGIYHSPKGRSRSGIWKDNNAVKTKDWLKGEPVN